MTTSTPDLRIGRQPHFIRKTHQIEEQLQRGRPVLHLSHRRAALVLVGDLQSAFPNDSVCSESSVAAASSAPAVVAAQLASRVRASWVGDPGSAV